MNADLASVSGQRESLDIGFAETTRELPLTLTTVPSYRAVYRLRQRPAGLDAQ
jgi:hypothetical protein